MSHDTLLLIWAAVAVAIVVLLIVALKLARCSSPTSTTPGAGWSGSSSA
jgi:hypothetical protein